MDDTRQEHKRMSDSLDQDHDVLAGLIRDLDATMPERNREATAFLASVTDLLDETRRHFQREEAWMDRISYGNKRAHRQQHERLMMVLDGLCSDFRSHPTPESALKIRAFVDEWLVFHMETADRTVEQVAKVRTDGPH